MRHLYLVHCLHAYMRDKIMNFYLDCTHFDCVCGFVVISLDKMITLFLVWYPNTRPELKYYTPVLLMYSYHLYNIIDAPPCFWQFDSIWQTTSAVVRHWHKDIYIYQGNEYWISIQINTIYNMCDGDKYKSLDVSINYLSK